MVITGDVIAQACIACCGVTSTFLTQSENATYRRWACLFGATAQPFWFYTTFMNGQWGIFGLCFLYAVAWGKGVYIHWIKPRRLK